MAFDRSGADRPEIVSGSGRRVAEAFGFGSAEKP